MTQRSKMCRVIDLVHGLILMTLDYRSSRWDPELGARPPDGRRRYQEGFRFYFDGFKSKYPTRAIFSFRPSSHTINFSKRILSNIRDAVRSPGLDGPSQIQRKGRLPTIDRCRGVFVTQIRGGLNDCAVPSLNIDLKKHELSIEWKALFSEFFHDKDRTKAVIQANAVSTPHCKTALVEKLNGSRPL